MPTLPFPALTELTVFRIALTLAAACLATSALAGASSNALPPPDPTAKNLSAYEISLRAFDACLITQSRLQNTTREAVHSACSCYAKQTIAKMSKQELQDFRDTGYFDDTTRVKALEAIDSCKLKRPI
jgi:hypothetical protein